MPIVFATQVTQAPSEAPVEELPVARPFTWMKWTGWDGSEWDLSDPANRMPAMGPGVQGLHSPRITRFKSSTPLVPGAELTGYTLPERAVYWPLVFRAESIDTWRATYSGFFDSIHPVEAGTWTVGQGKDERTLPLTGVFDDDYVFTRDPFTTGMALIGLELEATRPLWRGAPIVREFQSAAGQDFIGPEGGPPFHRSPVTSFHTATITNPGNEPAYLVWTVEGPLDSIELGTGGSVTEVPFAVPDGSVFRLDTDPAGSFATLNGAPSSLGFQMFAPVPPGGKTPLHIAATGAGVVRAELVPLYWRAF